MNPLPVNTAQEALLAPSSQFKKEAVKAVFAIVGFILVYLLLFALSLAVVVLCFYLGIAILSAKIAFYTILFSLGIMGCGVMIFVFLVKFLFAESKADNSDSIEISEDEQPVLFQTIHALAEAAGAPRPKKIFLSPDVNAAVFYNSSFWSLFLPVKKNLKIGLGLVNTLNVSELKAVVAHEFGHFSQRSMKVGSWVYQVNKILHDMLFNNSGYVNSLDSFARVHSIISLCVQATVKVVQGIQWVLHQMFTVVNRSYLGLSRQMEFHADLVAASVCGSNNIINALRRSEFADTCFATTMEVCNTAWKEQKVVNNFFHHHRLVVARLAALHQLPLVDNLPLVKENEEAGVTNRVNYKDQWASHPTLPERKAYLDGFDLERPVDATPAWTLFQNEDEWKEKLTKLVYRNVDEADVKGCIDDPQFETLLAHEIDTVSFPPVFKDFYHHRVVSPFDPDAVAHEPMVLRPFGGVLTEEALLLPKKHRYLQADIAVLQAIENKTIATSSFDFDGQKFHRNEAASLRKQLEKESESLQQELDAFDRTLFRFFYGILPLADAEALKSAYQRYFQLREKAAASLDQMNSLMGVLGPVFRSETLMLEEIQPMIAQLKGEHEPGFKTLLSEWMNDGAFDADPELKTLVQKFGQTDYQYFGANSFLDNELVELNKVVQESWQGINRYLFSLFKALTETEAAGLEERQQKVIP